MSGGNRKHLVCQCLVKHLDSIWYFTNKSHYAFHSVHPLISVCPAITSCNNNRSVSGHIAAACLSLHPKSAGLLQLTSLQTAMVDYCSSSVRAERTLLRGSFWACRHVTMSVLHSRHYTGCPFITGYSSRLRYSCTMHSLAGVWSTSKTSWHLLPVTPVDSNYDPTSLFLVAEQSSAVVPSQ